MEEARISAKKINWPVNENSASRVHFDGMIFRGKIKRVNKK
jgi:hypothetical protein